jgi:hypothetical protein
MTREERIEVSLATVGKTTVGQWTLGVLAKKFLYKKPDHSKENEANAAVIAAATDLRDEVIALRQQAKTVPEQMLEEIFWYGISVSKDEEHTAPKKFIEIAAKYGFKVEG